MTGNNLPAPTDAHAIETEIDTIRERMRDDRSGYLGDPAQRLRYRALVEAREARARPDTPFAGERRMKELRALMADRRSSYWRGPDMAELRAEYARLIGEREAWERGAAAPQSIRTSARTPQFEEFPSMMPRATQDEVRHTIGAISEGRRLLAAWDRNGGFGANASRASAAIETMLREIDDVETIRLFFSTFEGMPQSVQIAAYAELATTRAEVNALTARALGGATKEDLSEDLAAFRRTGAGASLAREWRGAAAHRLATVNARLDRIIDRLSPEDAAAAAHWLRAASDVEKTAAFRALGRA